MIQKVLLIIIILLSSCKFLNKDRITKTGSDSAGNNIETLMNDQKRIALVIGNGNYMGSTLANPENDAKAMTDVLRKLGFTVYPYENLNSSQMKKAIDDFGTRLKGNDVGLFFYAGHGIQAKGYNYLIPVDAQLNTEEQVDYDCVKADRVLALMETSGLKVNVIILDACRNNPFERSWTRSSNGQGLAYMNAPSGTIIAYSTSPGNTALDGSGENSPYTSAILESIQMPEITIIQMFQNVRNIVSQKTNMQQIPWESTSLTGDFYFAKSFSKNYNPLDKSIKGNSETSTNKKAENTFLDPLNNYRYKTVKIGKQIWMAENLRTNKFNDGKAIPLVTEDNEWGHLETPAYCWYNNDSVLYTTYGPLYNWYTVSTGKLCPRGWHVPSDAEWDTLIYFLGYDLAGEKLKEKGKVWELIKRYKNTSKNEMGFAALPGGTRYDGGFAGINAICQWWSSTTFSSTMAWGRTIGIGYTNIIRSNANFKYGYSMRCIKD